MSLVAVTDTSSTAAPAQRRISLVDRVWLVLRPSRLAVVGGLIVAAVTVAALTGAWAFVAFHAHCGTPAVTASDAFNERASNCSWDLYTKIYWQHWSLRLVQWTAILPSLAAVAWGVPVAREFEQRTHLLAWGQDVEPRAWLAARLAALLTLSAATATLVGLPANALAHAMRHRDLIDSVLLPAYFATGISTQVGYALLAVALGLLAGLALRHTLPAVAAAAAGCVAIRLGLIAVRPHLLPISTVTGPLMDPPNNPAGSWFLGNGRLTADGHRVASPPASCLDRSPKGYVPCLRRHGLVASYTDYQPAGHLVGLRLIEAGVCVVLAVLAVIASFWVLRRMSRR